MCEIKCLIHTIDDMKHENFNLIVSSEHCIFAYVTAFEEEKRIFNKKRVVLIIFYEYLLYIFGVEIF